MIGIITRVTGNWIKSFKKLSTEVMYVSHHVAESSYTQRHEIAYVNVFLVQIKPISSHQKS